MKTEEIIERLRNPQKYNTKSNAKQSSSALVNPQETASSEAMPSWLIPALGACILLAILITWLFVLNAKNKAENLTEALDTTQIEGLTYQTDFDPSNEISYVQITEGADRNVAVDTLGTTLPIISRYNYQSFTPENFKIIGLAPWALTENFAANLQDPPVIQYLLNRPEVGTAFISRSDVAPLLEDPQLLSALAQDNATLEEFFTSDTIQKMLANDKMVRAVGGSRFMSLLLISKAVKYYRDRPQEAAKLIEASPALNALRQNPGVRQAVQANPYLKTIAAQLLGPEPTPAPAPQATTTPAEK